VRVVRGGKKWKRGTKQKVERHYFRNGPDEAVGNDDNVLDGYVGISRTKRTEVEV
jgi:hypothetical protein